MKTWARLQGCIDLPEPLQIVYGERAIFLSAGSYFIVKVQKYQFSFNNFFFFLSSGKELHPIKLFVNNSMYGIVFCMLGMVSRL